MARNQYHVLLRKVPALHNASDAALARIASLVDTVELPAGTTLAPSRREVLITLDPTHVIVVDRRALASVEALTLRCVT